MNNEGNYAGFWVRVGACIVDSIIIGIINTIIVSILMFLLSLGVDPEEIEAGGALARVGLGFFLSFLIASIVTIYYYVFLPAKKWQATPGKRLLKIYVANADGSKPSKATYFGRTFIGYFVSGLILYIGFIMVAFHKDKKALHDILFSTVVLHGTIE